MPTTRDLQARLAALGHPPGPIDGIRGDRTEAAVEDALDAYNKAGERDLFHRSGLHRVHWHWTGGAEGVIALERRHYNYLLDVGGSVVEGEHPPEANASTSGAYAAHTLDANGGAIGIAIDAMHGARERPLRWGSVPMTWAHVRAMAVLTAKLCRRYWIPCTRWSTLSHAEVQPTLGIAQRRKWDITVLPGMTAVGDAVEIGDRIRGMVREHLQDHAPTAASDERDALAQIAEIAAPFRAGAA